MTVATSTTPSTGSTATRSGWAGRHPALLVGLGTALVVGWQAWSPGPWRDEGATWLIARRSVPQILELSRTVDLVHLLYYLLAHVVLQLDDSIAAVRLLISVPAMAVTAGLMVAIGRRLGSVRIGVVAGAVIAISPLASLYGQQARSYALATTVATASTLALLVALDQPRETGRRNVWARYAASVVLLGLINVLAPLVVAGHAVLVLSRGRGGGPQRRRWLITLATAGVPLVLFALGSFTQRGQVGWLQKPKLQELVAVLTAPWGGGIPALALVLGCVLAAGLLVLLGPGRWDLNRQALLLGASWALLPPALLWSVSQLHPLFDGRYVLVSLPGVALTVATLACATPRRRDGAQPDVARPDIARRPDVARPDVARPDVARPDGAQPARSLAARLAPIAVLAVIATVGLPAQRHYRDPVFGHSEDVHGAVRILAAQGRPGDGVLYIPDHLRIVTLMFPAETGGLDDIALGQDPISSVTITGVDLPAAELPDMVRWYRRIWVVTGKYWAAPTEGGDAAKLKLLQSDFTVVERREAEPFAVLLYQRKGAPAGS